MLGAMRITANEGASMSATLGTPVRTPSTRRRTRSLVVLATVLAAVVVWVIAIPVLGAEVTIPARPGASERVDLGVVPVLITSTVAALAGWALLAVLERFFRNARAIWTVVAVAVLVLSMPYAPGFTGLERVVLGLLHLTVAAVLIPGMRRTGAR